MNSRNAIRVLFEPMRNHKRFLLAALGGLMLLNTPAEVQAAPKKILVITQSAGFRHQPVNRAGKETCQVEQRAGGDRQEKRCVYHGEFAERHREHHARKLEAV